MEKEKRILVIDDEQDLCDILHFNLTKAGFSCEVAFSAEEALQKNPAAYDLLLLDVMMPGISGFELAIKLKENEYTKNIPIIFLTAKDMEKDMLYGFTLGADDYVSKPFSVREVLARVKAVLHRTEQATNNPQIINYRELTVDLTSKVVKINGEIIAFTRTEFDLLHILLSHPMKVFSRQQLIDEVWPSDVVISNRTVDVNITRLRKKIGPYANCIATRQGFGYYFSPDI